MAQRFAAVRDGKLVRHTDVDLGEPGLTADELARYGPTVVMEEGREGGDMVLIWTR